MVENNSAIRLITSWAIDESKADTLLNGLSPISDVTVSIDFARGI